MLSRALNMNGGSMRFLELYGLLRASFSILGARKDGAEKESGQVVAAR